MDVGSDFMRGVDASEVAALEELGQKWYDSDDTERDLFQILANHGVNWVRLRIWNDYTVAVSDSWGPYGYNNLNRTLSMAKRAKKAGLEIFLDFHYSDNWADPSKQYIPEMWKNYVEKDGVAIQSENIDMDGLSKAVADYTKSVINALASIDCTPKMVQLGNEMQGGIFQYTRTGSVKGCVGKYKEEDEEGKSIEKTDGIETKLSYNQRCEILLAAKNAVKAIDSNIDVALHCSDPGKYLDNFLSGYIANVNPDVVAISYYPYYPGHGTDVQLAGFMQKIAASGKKAVVAETSFSYNRDAYTDDTKNIFYTDQEEASAKQLTQYSGKVGSSVPASMENQAGVVKYIAEIASKNGGAGIFYWGGCYLGIKSGMPSSWENQTLFDIKGKVLPTIDVFKK